MSAAKQPPAKLAESIPAVTAPVNLPKLTPSDASFLANMIVAGVCGAGALVMLGVGIGVTL